MRRPIIAGNWKMNKTIQETRKFFKELIPLLKDAGEIDIVIAPSFPSVAPAAEEAKASRVRIAGQNVHWEEKGAFTGEVSVAMLKDTGAGYCIIGHSERRQSLGETDKTVNLKLAALLKGGLIPIVCVGETLQERTAGKTFVVLERQLREAMKGIVLKDTDEIVIAYEPVWAIGTGVVASPQQVQEAHAHVRQLLRKIFPGDKGDRARIQYGGSVTPANALSVLQQPEVDGALVGGASLNPQSFAEIIAASREAAKGRKQ